MVTCVTAAFTASAANNASIIPPPTSDDACGSTSFCYPLPHVATRLDAGGGARAARPAADGSGVPGADGSPIGIRRQPGAALLAFIGENGRLSRGLRLLPAGGALPHRRTGRAAALDQRSALRGREGARGRRDPFLHGRRL